MIEKVLIANRGEIAVRIIQACREMNIRSVAVYSNVDKDSLHVKLADEAVCIGDHKIENSYLNMNAIIQTAINLGVDAIHPGYGFLSEKAEFAKMCEDCNIEFIGPKSQSIKLMGHKGNARKEMVKANVPVVKGYDKQIKDSKHAIEIAQEIGCPIIIKAVAGGGGKGMKIAHSLDEVEYLYNLAQSESIKAFNDGTMYIEQFIQNPRHIEVQILADKYGNAVHLFERECSMQRNNQKLIEEAPANNLSSATRDKLYQVSLDATKEINYESAG
ncbi:MAG: biotin carboxylase N-terminal domain-containing protein, partial [Erysipelotrichales bacterium]